MSTRTAGAGTSTQESEHLSAFGYRQELRRSLSFFSNFGVAFTYLSPVVGIYSLFALGVGTGGPRYIWTIPIVVAGQLLVSLVFAELGSSYPLAGALYQWSRNIMGRSYGWWVGWIYAWALIITVASVDTGITSYVITLINNWFGTTFTPSDPNIIFVCTIILIAVQATINIGVVVALFPITGITLPFISAGGSSLTISLAAVGILLSVSRETLPRGSWNDADTDSGGRDGRTRVPGARRRPLAAHASRRP